MAGWQRGSDERDRFHASYYCPFVLVYDVQADQWHRLPTLMPVPTNDIWTAALVVQHDLLLYSRDAHFDRLPQLPRLVS